MPAVRIPPTQRFILENVSWGRYTRLLRAFEDRHLRMTFDRGVLEIMTLSHEHEFSSRFLGRMVVVLTEEFDLPLHPGGSTTMRRGGADISTTLKPSPPPPSSTICCASERARSKQVVSPTFNPMLKLPSTTRILCVRDSTDSTPLPPDGLTHRQTASAQGVTLSMARTISSTIRQRTMSRRNCSRRMRRAFFR